MNFTNINEFHEFWCTSDFRNIIYEFEPKWEKTQAGRPTPTPFSQCDSSKMALSKISSQDQVFNMIAIKQDRKAQTKSIWVHNSVTNYLTKTQLT